MTSTAASLVDLVAKSGSYLYDLVSRFISSLGRMAPIALVLGCQGPTVTPSSNESERKPAAIAEHVTTPTSDEPKPIANFTITFYYVIGEDEVVPKKPPANDNNGDEELAAVAGPTDQVTLYEVRQLQGNRAGVEPEFASQLAVQGTGKLRDGRVLNIWGRCKCQRTPCFKVTENQWGTAGSNHPLQPFRTVAVDPKIIKLGTLLYVPLLEGRTMPGRSPWGGYVHDGCVVADDTGGHINGERLDLFVGRKAYFLGLSQTGTSHAWARHVPVYDGSKICERNGRHVGRKSGSI